MILLKNQNKINQIQKKFNYQKSKKQQNLQIKNKKKINKRQTNNRYKLQTKKNNLKKKLIRFLFQKYRKNNTERYKMINISNLNQ